MFNKICRELEGQKDAKFEHNHWEIIGFAAMDNNLIDSIYSNLMTLSQE
jgi:hypothetical protein